MFSMVLFEDKDQYTVVKERRIEQLTYDNCACSLWKRQECQLLSSKIYIFWNASGIFNFNEIPFSPHKNVICVVHLICKCFSVPLLVCHNINLKLFFFNFLITFSKINIHFYVASSGKRGMEFWT